MKWEDIRRRLRSDDPEIALQADDDAWEEASIAASERHSPNSPGFDALVESIYEEICNG